uniref:protein-tyrosine-phosphatase n=1 Tax=Guillardia theta TaxID=55529 RepID=A0A7S4UIW3_GUITH|mmetsp:Transcript_5220/g.18618  ORF Transcript_5220/g.18618 Transcript_5220/m.18618 type:complete len:620 (+) Transcript_5220:77-1936(+)
MSESSGKNDMWSNYGMGLTPQQAAALHAQAEAERLYQEQQAKAAHDPTVQDATWAAAAWAATAPLHQVIEKLAPHLKGYIPVSSEPSIYDAPAMQGAQMAYKPGDPVSVPGHPDGTYSFGGWYGQHQYYIENSTGLTVWASQFNQGVARSTPRAPAANPKMIGAAIAAAATQRIMKSGPAPTPTWTQPEYQEPPSYQTISAVPPAAVPPAAVYTPVPSAPADFSNFKVGDPVSIPGYPDGTFTFGGFSGEYAYYINTTSQQSVWASQLPPPLKDEETEEPPIQETPAKRQKIESTATDSNEDGQSNIRVSTVLIWDLDETLIIFNSLLTGSFMHNKEGLSAETSKALSGLAGKLESLVYQVAEDKLFFKSLEGRNRWNFEAALSHDDGRDLTNYDFDNDGLQGLPGDSSSQRKETAGDMVKASLRYRLVLQKYKQAKTGVDGLKNVLGDSELSGAEAAIDAVNSLTDNWMATAEELLAKIWQYDTLIEQLCKRVPPNAVPETEPGMKFVRKSGETNASEAETMKTNINVLVTNGELVPTVVKLMLFGLHRHFHPSCIYSSREVGKQTCFAEILRRFSNAREIVAIGDSQEEEIAAKSLDFSFLKVSDPSDFRTVQAFLQ